MLGFWFELPSGGNIDKIWKWKVNAIRAMACEYEPRYLPYIEKALGDKNELVREMARWALERVSEG